MIFQHHFNLESANWSFPEADFPINGYYRMTFRTKFETTNKIHTYTTEDFAIRIKDGKLEYFNNGDRMDGYYKLYDGIDNWIMEMEMEFQTVQDVGLTISIHIPGTTNAQNNAVELKKQFDMLEFDIIFEPLIPVLQVNKFLENMSCIMKNMGSVVSEFADTPLLIGCDHGWENIFSEFRNSG